MTENGTIDQVGAPGINELARKMGDRLETLSGHREAVEVAEAAVLLAQSQKETATAEYKDAVRRVREEGLLTDALLSEYKHPVPKPRGRPANKSTA